MNEQTRLYEEPVRPEDQALRALAAKVLPEGRGNAIPRRDLVRIIQEDLLRTRADDDRMARRMLKSWRDAGAIIINEQDGRGYYIAGDDDTEAVLKQYRADAARAKSILRRQKHLRRWLRERGVEV